MVFAKQVKQIDPASEILKIVDLDSTYEFRTRLLKKTSTQSLAIEYLYEWELVQDGGTAPFSGLQTSLILYFASLNATSCKVQIFAGHNFMKSISQASSQASLLAVNRIEATSLLMNQTLHHHTTALISGTDTNFSSNLTSTKNVTAPTHNNQNGEPESPYFRLDLHEEKRERIDSSTPEPPSLIENEQTEGLKSVLVLRQYPLSN